MEEEYEGRIIRTLDTILSRRKEIKDRKDEIHLYQHDRYFLIGRQSGLYTLKDSNLRKIVKNPLNSRYYELQSQSVHILPYPYSISIKLPLPKMPKDILHIFPNLDSDRLLAHFESKINLSLRL